MTTVNTMTIVVTFFFFKHPDLWLEGREKLISCSKVHLLPSDQATLTV